MASTSGWTNLAADAAKSAGAGILGTIASLFPAHTIVGSWGRSRTGSGLTGAQMQQNDFNADQARIERDWQTDMDNTKVQRSVADMQAAGINPAMMMGNSGVTASTPSGAAASGGTPPPAAGDGFARAMQILFARQQYKMNNAAIDRTEAEAEKIKNEAKLIGLQSSWYPTLQESTIREIDSKIRGNNASADLDDAKAAHERVLTTMDSIEAEWRNELLRLEAEFKKEQTNAAKAEAARAYAAAALDAFDYKYMKAHGTHVPSGSSELVALASWITENLGTNERSIVNTVVDSVTGDGFKALGKGKDEQKRFAWLKDIDDDKLSDEFREKKHYLFK